MNEVALGTLPTKKDKDAVHVAIITATCNSRVYPGQDVGLINEVSIEVSPSADKKIGIVDPFLTHQIEPGVLFYVVLYPKTITGMKHHWEHPAFSIIETQLGKSEKWLRDFATRYYISYEHLLEEIARGDVCLGDDYYDGEYNKEVIHHYNVVTGSDVDEDYVSFRCAC